MTLYYLKSKLDGLLNSKSRGMELVQVAILIAIAIAVGLVFRERISRFVSDILNNLNADDFS